MNGGQGLRHCVRMLDPINQLFLTLVKLKLNLKLKDLAFRFGISLSVVSRYINTWICFLYHHLEEIDWTPSVNQVISTLPHSFKKMYPNTFTIIDGSEIFWRHPQIYACNPLHGANINITVRLNSLWHAHQMVLFLSFHLCSLVQYPILN